LSLSSHLSAASSYIVGVLVSLTCIFHAHRTPCSSHVLSRSYFLLSRMSAPPQPLRSIACLVSLIYYSYRLAVVLYRLPRSRALVLCLRGLASLLCLTSFFSLGAGVHRNIPARYVMPRRSAPVTQLVALTCHLHFLVPYSPSPIAYLVATPCCLI
jgi:hypothetical protein